MRRTAALFVLVVLALQAVFTIIASAYRPYHADIGDMFPAGAWFTAFLASWFGGTLAKRSSGIAGTLETAVVDVANVILSTALVIGLGMLVTYASTFVFPGNTLRMTTFDYHNAIAAFALPMAVFGWSAAVGTIAKRLQFLPYAIMPGLMVWYLLSNMSNVLGEILRVPVALNPAVIYAYQSFSTGHPDEFGPLISTLRWLTPDIAIAWLVTMAILGTAGTIAMNSKRHEVLA